MAALYRFASFLKPRNASQSLITRYPGATAYFHSDMSFRGPKRVLPPPPSIPAPPKRPISPYSLFVKERMTDLKRKNNSAKITEIMSEAAAEWNKLSRDEKQKYENMYSKAKHEYSVKKEEWSEGLTPLQIEKIEQAKLLEKEEKIKRKLKKLNRDRERLYSMMGKPKRPPHSFNLFLAEKIATGKEPPKPQSAKTGGWLFSWLIPQKSGENSENPIDKTSQKTILINAGREWNLKTEEEKRPYIEKAKKLSEKYKTEIQEWLGKRDEADKLFELEQAKKSDHSPKTKKHE